jgi:hypothetical protein
MEELPTSPHDLSSRDSAGGPHADDNDQPFFGFRTYQFSTRQLARLLELRSQLLDARLGQGAWVQDLAASC